MNIIAHTLRGDGFDASEDGTGRGTPIVPVSLCLTAHGGGRYDAESETLIPTNGGVFDVAPTLTRQFGEQSGQNHASGMLVSYAFGWQNAGAQGMAVTPFSPTLDKSKHPATVTYALGCHAGAADGEQTNRSHAAGGPVGMNVSEGLAYALRGGRTQAVATSRVRRLTPRECERLQGFPDDYSLVPWRGGMASDGVRYKALGNSWAVNCARWVGQRISMVDSLKVAA